MYNRVFRTIVLMGALAAAQVGAVRASEKSSAQPEPCYVVIAVDISGSMEGVDAPKSDSAGRRQTLRDEGQLAFLQLLPFLRSDLYVGVTHFSDRVRYSLPSEDTGPLLPWGQTYLSESACRNLVRSAEFQGTFNTDIPESMSWASSRIRSARQKYGQGSAKLILLSHGDPYDSEKELSRGGGPILSGAKRLAEQQIEVYPILINQASFHSGDGEGRLSRRDLAAEDLMQSVALMTGGKAYRLTREMDFPDILMDAFGLGMRVRDDLVVSPYDWAIVMVGAAFESVTVVPPAGTGGPASLTLARNGGLETAPGISANIVPSPRHQTSVLLRPQTPNLVNRCWQGRWDFRWPGEDSRAGVRIYRIPEFLVRLEAVPELPWWLNEQVQLKARLVDRHKRAQGLEGEEPLGSGQGLSVWMRGNSAVETNSFLLEKGKWAVPGRLYETEPFTIGVPGLYRLTGQLRDSVSNVDVPVLDFTSDVYVHSECVGMQVVSARDEVLQEVPPVAATVRVDVQGGQQVYFRAFGKGEFKVEPLSGVLHLEPLSQTQWPLQKDADGNLITSLVPLVEREERLTGWAEVDVRTFVGVRHIRLPKFELAYTPAPMRVECTFTDPREALWVGEFHKQPLQISAFPVFRRFVERTLRLFPEKLLEARIRTVNMRSGMMQVMGPESRQLEPPRTGGYEGRTVSATYFVESTIPLPAADRCEVDLTAALENLQGGMKTYAIVDPVAEGLFKWTVQQGPSQAQREAVSETLFCGEPVRFSAEWRSDQNVSAVRFEIPQPEVDRSIFIDMPVTSGASKTHLEQTVSGLAAGKTLPVYVHVTIQPSGADHALQIKLRGGQFRTDDRRVVLEDLTVGGGAPMDIQGYAWEPVEVPLKAVFTGYMPGDPQHSAAIEQFKKSCAITVTSRAGEQRNITDTIEWLTVDVEGATRTCRLNGHAVYMPDAAGRATLELKAEARTRQVTSGSDVQRAYAHIMAKDPRLVVTVNRLTPGGEEPVFDSRKWVKGDGGLSVLMTRLSTRLRVSVQSVGGAAGQPDPWRTTTRLLRRADPNAPWQTAFSDAGGTTPSDSSLREFQITDIGQYALEVAGQDPQSGLRTMYFVTPVFASVGRHEVKPAVAPPAWLTSRVRQWPFEYLVTLFQDSIDLSRSESVAFQFQLPGQRETWFDGAASSVGPGTADAQQLSTKGPRFLPAMEALSDGAMNLRLSVQGLEFLRWEYPNIRVVPPVLERLLLSRGKAGKAAELSGAELAFDGATDLWVRPVFRAAPELEGQWVRSEATIYMWRERNPGPTGCQADVRVLERLVGQEEGAAMEDADVQAFKLEGGAMGEAVRVLTRRGRWSFWGWPRPAASERYSLVASVAYRPQQPSGSAAGRLGTTPTDRVIAEWSDVYAVNLDTPWVIPLCWWPLMALLVAAALTVVLRRFVPSPSKLALDMRLEENVAIVEPVRLDNPVLLDLHETPFAREVQFHIRHLGTQWDVAGRNLVRQAGFGTDSSVAALVGAFMRGIACVVAPIQDVVRHAVYPRRWAWAAIIPRVRGDARVVRTGLLCVWTGLGARDGRAWSSQGGPLDLPMEGQVKSINMDLPYRAEGVDRSMRVTIRVRRMGTDAAETTTSADWQEAGPETSSQGSAD